MRWLPVRALCTLLPLLLLAMPGLAPRAQEEADLGEAARLVVQRLEQARGLFEQAEFARAIPLLGDLVDEIGTEAQAGLAIERRAVLLEALRLRGIALFNLGEAKAAASDFERLLRLNPRAELDAKLVSPKVLAVFTAARDGVTGTLAVRCTPPGAAVLVDGLEVGVTPLDPVRLAAGAHRLTLTRRDHAPHEEPVELAAGAALSREVNLVRNARSLRIVSVPAGVRVTLDGEVMGTTSGEPEAVLVVPSVAVGDRLLRAEKDCHQPLQATVAVGLEGDPEIPLDLQPLVLTPSIGRLEIASIPAGAAVTLDGVAVGTAPLDLETVCAGDHVLHLARASVGSWSQSVRVAAGEQRTVRAELRLGLVSLGAAGFGGDREEERETWTRFVGEVVRQQTSYRAVPSTEAVAQSRWEIERHLLESALGSTPLGEDLRRGLVESTGADLALLALRTTAGPVDIILIRLQDGRFDRLPARTPSEAELSDLARTLSSGLPEPHLWTGIVAVDVPDGLMVLRAPAASAGGGASEPQLGDRVLTVDGQPVADRRAFEAALLGREAGERVKIGIERGGLRREVVLPILASPDLEPAVKGAPLAVKLSADLERLRAMATSESELGLLGLRQGLALLQAGDPRGALAKGFGQVAAMPGSGVGLGMVELLRGICLEHTGEAGIGPAMSAYTAAAQRDAATLWRDDGILIGPLAAAFQPATKGATP